MMQLVKDVAMHGRANIRWVFPSGAVSRSYLYKKFREVIKNDPYLSRQFGDPAKLDQALDELLILYP